MKSLNERIARSDKKAFLSDQSKEIEENNRMGKTRDLFSSVLSFLYSPTLTSILDYRKNHNTD